MEIVRGEARRQLLEDLVPMPEAALLAHLSAFGMDQTISRLHRDDMAHTLARLLTVYAVSQDRGIVQRLAAEDLHGGSFTEAGAVVRFKDGREPITGLAVTRVALKAAVAALKDARAS